MVTGSADRTVKFWDLETFELIGSGGPEVLLLLWKEKKSLGRLSVSQNFDPSTKETKAIGRSSKPLGRLSVSQNSDVAKESRTLSCMLASITFLVSSYFNVRAD